MHTTLVDAQTLSEHLRDPHWVVVDCRYDLADKQAGYRNYRQGRVPGAAYADLGTDLSGAPATDNGRHPVPDRRTLERNLGKLGIANYQQVAAYDDAGGSFAARLWWLLRYAGHERAAVLDGGLQAWTQGGFELETGEPPAPLPAQFTATLDQRALVLLDEAATLPRLVDSRAPERYAGEAEPLDPVAGHIPGARNHYWKNNLDEQGRFLPPQRLRQALQTLYADAPAAEVAFYCGSGVTACHNLLAAVHAGYPLPRLYAGSWSEWCRDPARPVATGRADA